MHKIRRRAVFLFDKQWPTYPAYAKNVKIEIMESSILQSPTRGCKVGGGIVMFEQNEYLCGSKDKYTSGGYAAV
ncbi:hypothetical protein EUGRSUZ_L00775 [Eucalyptus grandis]|uniref:Uncharacterized protein n=1 Tax=Eucalyptus grandis TaxID=71139 RepID=A0A058ZVW5_EUCGR|nr:hypothetical protein EUGRSUZ_L00775 [Eucalyptus grandis]